MYGVIEEINCPRQVSRMCSSLGVSRSGYYRWLCRSEEERNLELREEIQSIALHWSAYGYRRITEELKRRGFVVNHKRVLRLMREDNLLCLRRRSFLRTTDSNHPHRVYPNLAKDLKLSGINQLWVADITYIRVLREFIYLAVILDAFSRRCLGWQLGQTLEVELVIGALQMALCRRKIEPGLVHHSDQGVQYCSREYIELLEKSGIRISMSRRGNPYDNAKVESFIKTLKVEEVYIYEYENIQEAKRRIENFLEKVYNQKRLHSALGYVPPAEFEQTFLKQKLLN